MYEKNAGLSIYRDHPFQKIDKNFWHNYLEDLPALECEPISATHHCLLSVTQYNQTSTLKECEHVLLCGDSDDSIHRLFGLFKCDQDEEDQGHEEEDDNTVVELKVLQIEGI